MESKYKLETEIDRYSKQEVYVIRRQNIHGKWIKDGEYRDKERAETRLKWIHESELHAAQKKEAVAARKAAEVRHTCQICGRAIKTKGKTAQIAHHGYEKPPEWHGAWTASCYGATAAPLEVSRDLIPEYIERLHNHNELDRQTIGKYERKEIEILKEVRIREGWNLKTEFIEFTDSLRDQAEKEQKRKNIIRMIEGQISSRLLSAQMLQVRYDSWTYTGLKTVK